MKIAAGARLGRASAIILTAALCGAAASAAQTPEPARVARPLPLTSDVKRPAPIVTKPSLPRADAPLFDANEPAAGEQLLPSTKAGQRAPRPDRTKVEYATDGDATWARGASYKASFARDGVTFVPFLGSDAPRNFPLTFRLAHLSLAGEPVPFATEVSGERSGEHIAFDRGAVVEVYDLAPESVEQSFVIPSLPRAGELVLRLSVEGELDASETALGLEFGNERGSVRYSRATVVDAAGRSASAPTTLAAGGIEIRVPASFLAKATFPVTVDPTFSTVSVDVSAEDTFAPDLAYDLTFDRFLTVYEVAFSLTDHDVYGMAMDAAGASVGYVTIDFTQANWQNPHVADNAVLDNFLVVAQSGPVGLRKIVGCTVQAGSLQVGPQLTISGLEAGEKINPQVGGDPTPGGSSFFCVVYERVVNAADHDIHARLVDPAGVALGGTIFVENSSGTVDSVPAISKSDGMPPAATQEWTIVWQRDFAPTDRDLFGAQIHWDGAITEPTYQIELSATDTTNPTVSSLLDGTNGPRRYLVAWEAKTGSGTSLQASVMNGWHHVVGVTYAAGADLSLLMGFNGTQTHVQPAVDTDGSTFAITYAYLAVGADYDIRVLNAYCVDNVIDLTESNGFVTNDLGPELRPRIVSEHSGGGASNAYVIGWDDLAGTTHDVYDRFYSAPIGGPQTFICGGTNAACPCGNGGAPFNGCANSVVASGAHLTSAGASSAAGDTLVLSGTGMPATAPCIYVQGDGSSGLASFGDGLRCVSGTLLRLGVKANAAGSSSYPAAGEAPISTKGAIPADGGTRYYQVWYRDPASFCTSATYNISSGVKVVWTP